VIGNYFGELLFLHNTGAPNQPVFKTPADRSGITIPTHTQDLLWCNYLSPFLYNWSGTGRLDLLMGDGTYSANSIYLFTNQGGNLRPVFNEKHRQKIIPGMGREHLTPQVVDWNNDGKPDIIAGERAGFVNVYLNQAVEKTDPPVFDKDNPIHIQFGGVENVGSFPTVCVADLNGDHLFDLIVSTADGRMAYSLNTGTLGSPKFGPLVPFKGTNPFPKVYLTSMWRLDKYRPYGIPFELLECVNTKTDPKFMPPPDTKSTGAAKFSIVDTHPVYFKDKYDPETTDPLLNGHTVQYEVSTAGGLTLQAAVRYNLSMWVRADGPVSGITWEIIGAQDGQTSKTFGSPFDAGSEWTKINSTVLISSRTGKPIDEKVEEFTLYWTGDGTLYFTDVSLKKAN